MNDVKLMYTIVDQSNTPVRFDIFNDLISKMSIYEESIENCFVYENKEDAEESIEYYFDNYEVSESTGIVLPLKVVKIKVYREIIE